MAGYRYTLLALPALLWAAVEVRVEPGREIVRPFETATIQLRFTGGDRPRGGAMPEGLAVRVVDRDGGWTSRPFHLPNSEDTLGVLYTAPAKTGKYAIEARFKSQRLAAEIEVTPAAPSHKAAESVSFGPESQARDVYRDLAEHYAPLVAQETWFEPKADFLARLDYDGDWRGDNNWDSLLTGSSQAYVYYAAMETATHYFLVYDFYHPRRYSDHCTGSACHENDSGGLVLTIRKDGTKYGRPQVMQTLAQNNIYSYTSDSRIHDGVHQINGELRMWKESHPVVFIESGGHGVFGAADGERSRFSPERQEFLASTGVVYRFGGVAGRPRHPNDRDVSYELLNAAEQWWPRATSRQGLESRTFDDFSRYAPYGNRPRAAASEIAGAFLGRKYFANQARPFWGWHDTLALNRKLLAPGQWGLDPAYAVSVTLKLPSGVPFSLDYIYNSYLQGKAGPETITALPPTTSFAAAPRSSPGGERHPLSPPAEKPNYRLKDHNGQLEFRARVDGAIYLYIHGDQIEVEYLSGRPIDEIRYKLSQPLPLQELNEPLPLQELNDVKLDDIEGRGTVRLLEWPNAGNQFTAKIRIVDDKPGASNYRFRLSLKR
ncbi:MAG: hypothetical protein HY238_14535 [Acidobacteria bacterium]|nr:hypothetical protein [Acidobacteriota bacterium]